MKIAVLGSTGMAGHVVAQYLEERGYEVFRASRSERTEERRAAIDVTNFESLGIWLDSVSPHAVVNCVGLLQKACDARPDMGVLINSYLPHWLEHRFAETPVKLVHLSTDCVFSGSRGEYREDDLPDGMSVYDRTKALGELRNGKDLTFRMSIIGPDIDPEGTGLFNWFMKQKGEIWGYGRVYWNGVTTVELARAIECALKDGLTGLYHLTPAEGIDKCSLLRLFQKSFSRDYVTIRRTEEPVVNKILVNTRTDFRFSIPDYPSQVDAMREWIEAHKSFYPHYIQ